MALPPSPQPIPYELPQPFGELSPYPEKDQHHSSQEQKSTLSLGRSEEHEKRFISEEEYQEYEDDSDQEPAKPFEDLPAERDSGLRRRKLAAAAAGANP